MNTKEGYGKKSLVDNRILTAGGGDKNILDIINNYGVMSVTPSWTFSNPINADILGNATTADRIKNDRTGTTSSGNWAECKIEGGVIKYYDRANDDSTTTAIDNILAGSNSGTAITYAPYTTLQSKLSFDTSATNPSRSDRLNLNGYLYASRLYSENSEVVTVGKTLLLTATKRFSGCDLQMSGPSLETPDIDFVIGSKVYFSINSSSTEFKILARTTSNTLLFNSNGNLTISGAYYANSDIRYKNIIEQITNPIEDVANLPIFKYYWKDRVDITSRIGTSAQDVEKILPELVTTNENGFKSVDYATLGTTLGIMACKELVELRKRVKELEDKING